MFEITHITIQAKLDASFINNLMAESFGQNWKSEIEKGNLNFESIQDIEEWVTSEIQDVWNKHFDYVKIKAVSKQKGTTIAEETGSKTLEGTLMNL